MGLQVNQPPLLFGVQGPGLREGEVHLHESDLTVFIRDYGSGLWVQGLGLTV